MILNIFLITFILLIIIIYSYNKESFQNNETNGTLEWDLIYQHKSKWQDIEFVKRDEDNTWALYLNNEIQVYSEEYELSHYLQCSLPIEKYKPKNILILGGGDLIAAAFCLKYNFVESVTLVEIDSEVVKFAKENETFRQITNDVSKDKRLSIIIGDAIQYIQQTPNKYDFIIEDVEIDFTNQKSDISVGSFLKNCLEKAPIYCGSFPSHRIKDNSDIINISKQKKPSYITIPNTNTANILTQLHFSKKDLSIITPFIPNYTIHICSYYHGKLYGTEAYLLITMN
jgi:hypothetical protein|tara:strand:+ start:2076 stop:2930 length:855 start_codon:yes stop_codon:yes gene_type:complete